MNCPSIPLSLRSFTEHDPLARKHLGNRENEQSGIGDIRTYAKQATEHGNASSEDLLHHGDGVEHRHSRNPASQVSDERRHEREHDHKKHNDTRIRRSLLDRLCVGGENGDQRNDERNEAHDEQEQEEIAQEPEACSERTERKPRQLGQGKRNAEKARRSAEYGDTTERYNFPERNMRALDGSCQNRSKRSPLFLARNGLQSHAHARRKDKGHNEHRQNAAPNHSNDVLIIDDRMRDQGKFHAVGL